MASSRPHILAVPVLAQGHLNPLMRFCKVLASHGMLITFVDPNAAATTSHEDRIVQDPESNIRRVPIPPLVVPDATNTSQEFSFKASMEGFEALRPSLLELVARYKSTQEPRFTCILSDVILSSITLQVAATYNLPLVAFSPCSKSSDLFYFYLSNGELPVEDAVNGVVKNNADLLPHVVPGLPPLRNRDLPLFKVDLDETEFMYRFISRQTGLANTKADMLVLNTFEELEVSAFHAEGTPREVPVYAIGPLKEDLSGHTNMSLWKEQDKCLDWLDEQPASSVLYISLGSFTVMSKAAFEELIHGVEASNQRFLWVVRPGMVEGETSLGFPDWFLKSTKQRGYMVSWAPQMKVLGHAAVGGFMTHCGWNAVMEAMGRGVVMLCMPHMSEQYLNVRFVVEEWKTGLRLGGRGEVVSREKVEKLIRVLMEGEEGKRMRENASRLSQASHVTLRPGGSSHANIQTVLRRLSAYAHQ